ncbi:hypothetical protein NL676_009780 [Syzygium grande]|nr:hypothetical protein NL676_009780 [Syzygium grande]
MGDLVHNLTGLKELHLSSVIVSSSLPVRSDLFPSLSIAPWNHRSLKLNPHLLPPRPPPKPRRDGHKQNQKQGLPPPPQGLPRQARRHEDHPLLLPPARNPTPSINGRHSRVLSKISAWAEFVEYIGSVNLKIRDLRRLREDETRVASSIGITTSREINWEEEELKLRKLWEKKLMKKKLSVVQDLAELAEPEGLPSQAVAELEALEAAMVVLLVAVAARVLVVVGEGGRERRWSARDGWFHGVEREKKETQSEPAERRRGERLFQFSDGGTHSATFRQLSGLVHR